MKKLIASISALGLLALALPALAAPFPNPHIGSHLNGHACDADGRPILNVTFKVQNDDDSGVAGNAWAKDDYNKSIQVWPQDDGTFCAIVRYEGDFVTNAGASPQNTGTLTAGIQGEFHGGYQANFDGTFTPTLPTHGNLGTFDYACDGTFNCPGAFNWVSAYFSSNTSFDQPYWAWIYRTGNNGSWLNAITGNAGDITN